MIRRKDRKSDSVCVRVYMFLMHDRSFFGGSGPSLACSLPCNFPVVTREFLQRDGATLERLIGASSFRLSNDAEGPRDATICDRLTGYELLVIHISLSVCQDRSVEDSSNSTTKNPTAFIISSTVD